MESDGGQHECRKRISGDRKRKERKRKKNPLNIKLN
jgi:hypothetical protein